MRHLWLHLATTANLLPIGFMLLVSSVVVAQQVKLQSRPDQANPATPVPLPLKAPAILQPALAANANAIYQALRSRIPNGEAFTVSNVVLRRDAAVFTLSSGIVYFYGPVASRTTGAVFLGTGTLHVEPPSDMERRQLKAMMKSEVLDQPFTSAVFSFTDGTATELKQAAQGPAVVTVAARGRAEDTSKLFREDLKYNLEARLLEDLLLPPSPTETAGTGFFLAEVKAGTFSKRLILCIDPNGAIDVAPEEVALLTSSNFGYDITLGFHTAQSKLAVIPSRTEASLLSNKTFSIAHQSLDLTVEGSGKIIGRAVTAITATKTLQVIPLDLAPSLRVSGVWGPGGEALDFVQEDKLRDASLAVILPKPLLVSQTLQLTTQYAGKDAVLDEGNNNYYLVARQNWYPNVRGDFGNYAFYDMTFHTPKAIEVVATGNKLSDQQDGKLRTSLWQTTTPIAVAGFNLGGFKSNKSERSKNFLVVSYANTDLASRYSSFTNSGMAVGTMSTTGMLKQANSEADAALESYTEMFGPLPYDHVFLTQQTACNYGQSWPMLVYLPICYFWDSTIQHQIGVLDHNRDEEICRYSWRFSQVGPKIPSGGDVVPYCVLA